MFRGASLFLCLNWVVVVVWLVSTFEATDATVVVLVCLCLFPLFLLSLTLSPDFLSPHFVSTPFFLALKTQLPELTIYVLLFSSSYLSFTLLSPLP